MFVLSGAGAAILDTLLGSDIFIFENFSFGFRPPSELEIGISLIVLICCLLLVLAYPEQ